MGNKKRKGRSVRSNKVLDEPEELVQAPHSFIIHRGLSGEHIIDITKDFRNVMKPFTATNLKERKKNTIKDFVSISGVLHVSHMCIFTLTELGMYLKILKMARGPTLTFKIHNFTLARDVISSLKKQFVHSKCFKHSPLIILNNFSGEGMHIKLMASTFQNMFPTINLTKIKLTVIRRCVLLNYDPVTKLIEFRHYAIKAIPVGISKGVKKVVQGKVPNLEKCNDISEFLTKSANLSESELEDEPSNHVTLPQKLASRGNAVNSQSAIRLYELGPRLTLQLIKIEDGLLDGEVLFHELIQKTEKEIETIKKKREQKRKLKEKIKKQQSLNTEKKLEEKERLKQKSLEGMKKAKLEKDRLMKKAVDDANKAVEIKEDDDVEYYRQEVGEEPDKELFTTNYNRKRQLPSKDFQNKKPRLAGKETKLKDFNKEKHLKFNNKSRNTFSNKKWNGNRETKSKYAQKGVKSNSKFRNNKRK